MIQKLECDFTVEVDFIQTTFADLEVQISEKTGIPVDSIALIRRVSGQFKNFAKAERINNNASRPKRLCESHFKLQNNDILFVE